MKIGFSRLVATCFVASTLALGLSGCESDWIAVGVGASIGNAGVDGHHHRPYPRCHAGSRTVCSDYWDRWGGHHRECRRVYDRCGGYYSASLPLDGENIDTASPEAADLAETYHLSFDAADKVLSALDSAKTGDLSKARVLGLNEAEVVSIAQGRSLSSEAKAKLASELNTTEANATAFVENVTAKVREQAADGQSALWKACRAGGKWKTPQNQSCREQWWPGCDPSNGATFCAAL